MCYVRKRAAGMENLAQQILCGWRVRCGSEALTGATNSERGSLKFSDFLQYFFLKKVWNKTKSKFFILF